MFYYIHIYVICTISIRDNKNSHRVCVPHNVCSVFGVRVLRTGPRLWLCTAYIYYLRIQSQYYYYNRGTIGIYNYVTRYARMEVQAWRSINNGRFVRVYIIIIIFCYMYISIGEMVQTKTPRQVYSFSVAEIILYIPTIFSHSGTSRNRSSIRYVYCFTALSIYPHRL